MSKRTALIVAGVVVLMLASLAWFSLSPGGPIPSRAQVRANWDAAATAMLPPPKPGEPDAWALFSESNRLRKEADAAVWRQRISPDMPDMYPDFTLLGKPDVGPDSNQPRDTDRYQQSLKRRELAEKMLPLYRQAGVFVALERVIGVNAGNQLYKVSRDPEAPLMDLLIPHGADVREFTRINAARMRLASQQNNLPEFTSAFQSNMALARLMSKGATLIDRLTAIAVESVTLQSALAAIHERPDPAWLDTVEAGVGSGFDGIPFSHNLAGERWAAIDTILVAHEKGRFGPTRVAIDVYAAVSGTPKQGSAAENVREVERYFDAYVKLADLSHKERALKAPDEVKLLSSISPFRTVQLVVPAMNKALQSHDNSELTRRAVRLSVLVERFRLKNGRLPANWTDLGIAGTALSADPFSTGDLGYRIATAEDGMPCGYVIYTVGLDGSDDGGRELPGSDRYKAISGGGEGVDFIIIRH